MSTLCCWSGGRSSHNCPWTSVYYNAGDAGSNSCESRKRMLSQCRTVDIVAHALDSPEDPDLLFSFFPKKMGSSRGPRNWRDMDPLWIPHSDDVNVLFILLFCYFSLFSSPFAVGLALRYSLFPFFNVNIRSLHLTYTIWIFRNP